MRRADSPREGEGVGPADPQVAPGLGGRRRGWPARLSVWLVFALGLGGAAVGRAADCGGSRPCQCGDRLVASYRLENDLGPCDGLGLRVRGRVVLDGAGHAIRGRGSAKSAGLVLDKSANESQILHLEVTGFERGVRLNGVSRAKLFQVHAHHNGLSENRVGYGIDVAGAASDNRLERVEVDHNADEGIHFGTAARDNRLADSNVHDNGREDVYLLRAPGTVVERSKIGGAGSASLYVKDSKGVVLRANEIRDVPVVVRGGTTDLLVLEQTFRGAGFVADPYDHPKLGLVRPTRLTLRGGSIEGTGSCVNLGGATRVLLDGIELRCGDRPIRLDDDSDVTVLGAKGATPRAIGVQCAGPGMFRLGRDVELRVVDGDGRGLSGATLRASDGISPTPGSESQDAAAVGPERFPALRADMDGWIRGALAVAARACPESGLRRATRVIVRAGPGSLDLELPDLPREVKLRDGAPEPLPKEDPDASIEPPLDEPDFDDRGGAEARPSAEPSPSPSPAPPKAPPQAAGARRRGKR